MMINFADGPTSANNRQLLCQELSILLDSFSKCNAQLRLDKSVRRFCVTGFATYKVKAD